MACIRKWPGAIAFTLSLFAVFMHIGYLVGYQAKLICYMGCDIYGG